MPGRDTRELAAIFAGGAVGALLRVALLQTGAGTAPGWPWVTFGVNIFGTFLLGYFALNTRRLINEQIVGIVDAELQLLNAQYNQAGIRRLVGIVTVRTTGFNQDGTEVISFKRTAMVYRRGQAPGIAKASGH